MQNFFGKPEGNVDTLLIDLSNAFDSVNHELINAKLAAYRLNEGSLIMIQNYLSKLKKKTACKQRFFPERIDTNYSRCPSKVNIRIYFI